MVFASLNHGFVREEDRDRQEAQSTYNCSMDVSTSEGLIEQFETYCNGYAVFGFVFMAIVVTALNLAVIRRRKQTNTSMPSRTFVFGPWVWDLLLLCIILLKTTAPNIWCWYSANFLLFKR